MFSSLKQCYLFNGISKQDIKKAMSLIEYTTKEYAKNEIVFSEVKFLSQLGIVVAGEISVIKNHYSGRLINLNVIKSGFLLGLSTIFNDEIIYPSEFIVQKKSKILFINEVELMKLFNFNSKVLENYLSYVSNRINFLNNKIEVFTYNNIEDRVLHFLRLRCNNLNKPIVINMSKKDLANYLAISRSSLYRVLDRLKEKDLIEFNKGHIFLTKQGLSNSLC